jgi:hypothetical protein
VKWRHPTFEAGKKISEPMLPDFATKLNITAIRRRFTRKASHVVGFLYGYSGSYMSGV